MQLAIESQLSREAQWTVKTSTIVQCDNIYQSVAEDNLIPTHSNCHNYESSLASQTPILKTAVRNEVQSVYKDIWREKVERLVSQGDFLKLLESEQSDVTWKGLIYGVPKGVMAFAMRSATNTLATPDNLKKWKRVRSDDCLMCRKPNRPADKATLHHILNHCSGFLGESERFTWRHDSVLTYLAETLTVKLPDNIKVYADLPGYSINGGTLPPHIAITSSRPDLVIIDSADKTVWLLELTVSFETNFEAAHNRKKVRYTALAQDIVSAGYNCQNIPFEIGSRGHISLANKSTLTVMHSLCKPDERLRTFVLNISKISLLCSYSIFLSRKEPTWTSVEPLRARK